ncbi:MAG: hypothetical protein L3K10_08625 [Thermoplasmata archaeon]|nr:hypothetical protein [Thermoplasmata archaeon]
MATGFPRSGPSRSSSTTIVVILVVVLAVLFFAGPFLFFLAVELPRGEPGLPTGPYGFAAGNPRIVQCPPGSTFASQGCSAGHYAYALTIEVSSAPIGEIQFQVLNGSRMVDVAMGGLGFSILGPNSTIVGQVMVVGGTMASGSGWTTANGATASTLVTNLYSIVVDMGRSNPLGTGLLFQASVSGPQGVSMNTISLP